MIKLIVCDMDGTLLDRKNSVDLMTLDKIKKCMNKGIDFMFATGRDFNMVVDFCKKLEIYEPMILNNGTQYRTYDGVINEYHGMHKESFLKIIHILQDHGYHISIHTNKGKYILQPMEEYFDIHVQMLLKSRNVKSLDELPKTTFFTREGFLRDCHFIMSPEALLEKGIVPLKIDARHPHVEKVSGMKTLLKDIPHLDISSSYEDNIEITCGNYNKGIMLKKVLEERGLTLDEVATFGDGLNDIPMLEGFPYSFAPLGANTEAIKKASHHLTHTCNDGAVYEGITYLEKHHLL